MENNPNIIYLEPTANTKLTDDELAELQDKFISKCLNHNIRKQVDNCIRTGYASNPRENIKTRNSSNSSSDIFHPNFRKWESTDSSNSEKSINIKPENIKTEKVLRTYSSPSELYYVLKKGNFFVLHATKQLLEICNRFEDELVQRSVRLRVHKFFYQWPPRNERWHKCSLNDNSDSDSSESDTEYKDALFEALKLKKNHPDLLHPQLWYNEPGELNIGPLCYCGETSKKLSVCHNVYAGEKKRAICNIDTNNVDTLYHYRLIICPLTNLIVNTPTVIEYNYRKFTFEGFSMFSHRSLQNLPVCKVVRYNVEYSILYLEEEVPQNFTIRELDLFHEFLFKEILELVDFKFKTVGDGYAAGCDQFHFMPRFVCEIPENGKELLSMNVVLDYLLQSSKLLVPSNELDYINSLSDYEWQKMVDGVKGMIVTNPGKKPRSIRVDYLNKCNSGIVDVDARFPEVVHFSHCLSKLRFYGNPEYLKIWKEYVKFHRYLANMPNSSLDDIKKLEDFKKKLKEIKIQSQQKPVNTVAVSSKGFYKTGIMCDIVQHSMLIPSLVAFLRFHCSLDVLEAKIKYKFKNRKLLQLALTHSSSTADFGINLDHIYNTLNNCGICKPQYGDLRINYLNEKQRGGYSGINAVTKFCKKFDAQYEVKYNEKLIFLGQAVIQFVVAVHLFHLFPQHQQKALYIYKSAISRNRHLAILARKVDLDRFILHGHGFTICDDLLFDVVMSSCLEALMGSIFLDGSIEAADKVFAEIFFENNENLKNVWTNYPLHPLLQQEPSSDRHWIQSCKILENLSKFENLIGISFKNIRLLAHALTGKSIGCSSETLGSNKRLRFLGDSILLLVTAEYLYFSGYHEVDLAFLSCFLRGYRTLATISDDLGMSMYILYSNSEVENVIKSKAGLLEAFLGALYIDKGLKYCKVFCEVCLFSRIENFLVQQDWNNPKLKLQYRCLASSTPGNPVYKVIDCKGPPNNRFYTVAVYFKGKRLAEASARTIKKARMNAAAVALENSQCYSI